MTDQTLTANSSIREIPYNYTSFSDREIVIRVLGREAWDILNELRQERVTGRSARMLFEILGDLWVVMRNPFLEDDLLANQKRHHQLSEALTHRLQQIQLRHDQHSAEQRPSQQVTKLIQKVELAIHKFDENIEQTRELRKQVKKRLVKETSADNIDFSGLARVSHVTDASDWRVEFPFVLLYPDYESEVRNLVEACLDLGLSIIPRGGGTGYTGGAVPLRRNCVVINTEKLDSLAICEREEKTMAATGAGVVTRRVSELAEANGLTFAVDPTSQDASCIGGNIAMNAGGKKAVMWGTTLDNLYSWKMVTPDAQWVEIQRLDHNYGKIHTLELVRFAVRYLNNHADTIEREEILEIPGKDLRKQGLGKDVTNKFLGGLPGVQKEGCDGIITSAVFVLHQMPKYMRTLCFEFFSKDSRLSVPAIVATKEYIESQQGVFLTGLEHLDERYIQAVDYSTKSARGESPKMLLLADIAAEDEQKLALVASELVRQVNQRDAEGFIAVSPEARKRFWLDRAKTAAIAAHTNAFKLNEDVVIPLHHLGEYTLGIEKINIQEALNNKLEVLAATRNLILSIPQSVNEEFSESSEAQELLRQKCSQAERILNTAQVLWQWLVDNMEQKLEEILPQAHQDIALKLQHINIQQTIFEIIQSGQLIISFNQQVQQNLLQIFKGIPLKGRFNSFAKAMEYLYDKVRKRRIFVATHMHAGDGNVHTNIPVHSNDYAMLSRADEVVEQVMSLAIDLGGVISGEHGIGLTKMQFLDKSIVDSFRQYKDKIDPKHVFNPGKLMADSGLENAYTPSLRLLQQEALIMEASEFGELNDAVKDCLRCGKCKPVCNTHIPRANLLYSPRNKILASGMIIEAFLYEEQTRRGISTQHFDELNDIADHCTICHKCFNPCPVNIDFGDVSILLRKILKDKNERKSSLMTLSAMAFLNLTDPTSLKLMRKTMIEWGYTAQRYLAKTAKRFAPIKKMIEGESIPSATQGKMTVQTQVVHFFKKPMPNVPSRMLRDSLALEDSKVIPIIRNPKTTEAQSEAVFYFPGCGSERLFSQIGAATLAMLYELDVQVVLPPGYLCCGYPQTSSGDNKKGQQISTDNQVLFHRIANTLNYLDIKTVLVSCGTCIDQLMQYQFRKIFPGSRLMDIHEYLMEKGVQLETSTGKKYIYHDPCHSPMKIHNPLKVGEQLLQSEVILSDRCCGESGTLAVSRPDISTQLRYRKLEELEKNKQQLGQQSVKLLTSCPACQQGLSRYQDDSDLAVDYIVVELCKAHLGENWYQDFINRAQQGGIERVLL